MADQAVLVCIELDRAGLPPCPSVTDRCTTCGTPVWVAHTSAARVRAGGIDVTCVGCAFAAIRSGEAGDVQFGLLREQVDQLAEWGILDWSREFVRAMQSAADRYAAHPEPAWEMPPRLVETFAERAAQGYLTQADPRAVRRSLRRG